MNKRNYQRELTELLRQAEKENTGKKRLLLHCCCAPCSSYVLEYLNPYFDITVFFYNPNITEEKEYRKRKQELMRYLSEVPFGKDIHTEDADYEPECFLEMAKGHEKDAERGERCRRCFGLRLQKTAERAAAGGYDYFCTTLSISPHKDAELLMTIGEACADRFGVAYLPSDFKKQNGYKRSIELSRIHDLYRQDYCGCLFSKQQRQREKERLQKLSKKMRVVLTAVVLSGLMLFGCADRTSTENTENTGNTESEKVQREIFAMDTIMNITLYGEQAGQVMNQAADLIHRYEELFSVNKKDSDTARINAATGGAVQVSEETYELIQKSIVISGKTEGLFDISVYPLVKEWGFTTETYRIPSVEDRQRCIGQIDYKKIRLLSDRRVQIEKDMQIDLGAVAKGYLSQKLMELFRQNGITSAIVSLGGNVQTIGTKEDGSSFHIGITDPADGSSLYGTLDVRDKAVVTSGIYQRYFTENGKTYHHIMDRRTGGPAENTLASVTVIAQDGTEADGLATALYVMGEEGAVEYQRKHPEIQLILIRKDGTFFQSDGAGIER